MKNKGFTLFIAIMVTGTLLLIATGIVNLSVKQSLISNSGRESQLAFYAADTGMECALFWDVKNPSGVSAFSITTPSTISCNQDVSNPGNQWQVGGASVSTINRINFLPASSCAIVTVTKNTDGTTLIESKGYNTCDPANPRRVERAVRATYGLYVSGIEVTGSSSTIARGNNLTVTWQGVSPATNTDWVGLYTPAAADNAYVEWFYTSSPANPCNHTSGSGVPPTAGTCQFLIPGTVSPGTYELRIFSENGYTRLDTSPPITITN